MTKKSNIYFVGISKTNSGRDTTISIAREYESVSASDRLKSRQYKLGQDFGKRMGRITATLMRMGINPKLMGVENRLDIAYYLPTLAQTDRLSEVFPYEMGISRNEILEVFDDKLTEKDVLAITDAQMRRIVNHMFRDVGIDDFVYMDAVKDII